MQNNNSKHAYKDRKYDIVQYDPRWPRQFEEYAAKIRDIFGQDIQIEHIGSTSVPGMSGKACIDLLVIPDDLHTVDGYIQEMKAVGFEYSGQVITKDSHLFQIFDDNVLKANIHFFPQGHRHITEMINLRNYLRSHPEEMEAYSELKKELHIKYSDDYASYRKLKDEYMEELKNRVSGSVK